MTGSRPGSAPRRRGRLRRRPDAPGPSSGRESGRELGRWEWGRCLILFGLALVYLLPGINDPVNLYDEGIVAYGATRVASGEVPYRDFWTLYSPGSFYAVAATYALFGTTLVAERALDTVIRALLAVFAYLVAARLTSRSVALLAWAAVMVWMAYYTSSYEYWRVAYGANAFPALMACLASIWTLSLYFERQHRGLLVGAGVVLGAAALFRHDFAGYAGVAEAVAVVLFSLLRGPSRAPAPVGARAGHATALLAYLGSGVALVVVPVAGYFIARVGIEELVSDLFVLPMTVFPRFRALPYPPWGWVTAATLYLPFVVFAGASAIALIVARRRTDESLAYALDIQMLTVFGLLGFNYARVRPDLMHTLPLFVPAVVLLVALVRGLPTSVVIAGGAGVSRAVSVVAMLAFGGLLVAPLWDRARLLADPARLWPPVVRGLERAGRTLVPGDMAQALRYVRSVTAPDERIFIGVPTHDRMLANEPMFYFLAERVSATRYHELHPGVATTAPVQREIAADLTRAHVAYIVVSRRFEREREPNASARSSGIGILDDYIARNYSAVARFGTYTIWKRR